MKQVKLSRFFKAILLMSTFSCSALAFNNIPTPTPIPPVENPHRPITAADQNRVRLAEQAVKLLLAQPLPPLKSYDFDTIPPFQNKDSSCLQKVDCYAKDYRFGNELIELHQKYGEVAEWKHGHVVPWAFQRFQQNKISDQKPQVFDPSSGRAPAVVQPERRQNVALEKEEYTVHFYARFKQKGKASNDWYHLQVIVTEGAKGKIFLRHFDVTPLGDDRSQMPLPPC